jgi:hypothetical protein
MFPKYHKLLAKFTVAVAPAILAVIPPLLLRLTMIHATAAAAGCATGPSVPPPAEAWPWDTTACATAAVGQACFTSCNWPSYDGPGFYVTCLLDGTWSGAGGLCLPSKPHCTEFKRGGGLH